MKCIVLFAILGLTLSLGGCASDPAKYQLPSSQIPATQFQESRFKIPPKLPPPATGADADGSYWIGRDQAHEQREGVIEDKLTSVGQELDKNGQVVHAAKPAKPMFRKTKTTKKAGV
jgi:hypothetical protein